MRPKPSFHAKQPQRLQQQDEVPTCECCGALVDARTASRVMNNFGALLCMACYMAGATTDNRAEWPRIAAQVNSKREQDPHYRDAKS